MWMIGGPIQSAVLSGALLGMGRQVGLIALVPDLISVNRKLFEQIRLQFKETKTGKDD